MPHVVNVSHSTHSLTHMDRGRRRARRAVYAAAVFFILTANLTAFTVVDSDLR